MRGYLPEPADVAGMESYLIEVFTGMGPPGPKLMALPYADGPMLPCGGPMLPSGGPMLPCGGPKLPCGGPRLPWGGP